MANLEGLRVALTGASGFIGANVLRHLVDRGVELHAVVTPTTPPWRLQGVAGAIRLHRGDVTDRSSLISLFRTIEPTGIIHAAAYGVGRGQRDPEKMLRVNVLGTSNTLEAAVRSGSDWSIHAGSVSETTAHLDGPEPRQLRAGVSYVESKALAAQECAKVARETGYKVVSLRLFTPYGPYESPDRLIPTVLLGALRDSEVRLSIPSSVRDFVFVEDAAIAYRGAVENIVRLAPGATLEVGTGRLYSVGEVVSTAEQVVGKPLRVLWGTHPSSDSVSGAMRPAAVDETAQAIHWVPARTLAQGLKESYEWFEAHTALYAGAGNS